MKDIKNIKLFDATLRDGSHAIEHQFTAKTIENYCQAIDGVGMHTVLVGHGNGLGASSLQVGLSLLPEREILSIARKNLSKTKLGIYMIPGFGTIRDNLIPAIEEGVEVFKIGCNCTEANITRQHIEFLKEQENEEFVFVKWDEEKQCWIDRDGEGCYPCDAAPNVLLADNNDLVYGNVVISAKYVDNLKYRVKLITDGTCIDEPAIDIIDVPMNYLAGNTELEIYEWVVRNL